MRRKILLGAAAAVVCLGAVLLWQVFGEPRGATLESREELLNASIAKGTGWTILRERELGDQIISAACSADGWSALAVFRPTREGGYEFSTSTNRQREEIIVGGTLAEGVWYDLIWFGGAQTEHAQVRYTVAGQEGEPLEYDTGEMEILAIPNQEKEYTLQVSYTDAAGKIYE